VEQGVHFPELLLLARRQRRFGREAGRRVHYGQRPLPPRHANVLRMLGHHAIQHRQQGGAERTLVIGEHDNRDARIGRPTHRGMAERRLVAIAGRGQPSEEQQPKHHSKGTTAIVPRPLATSSSPARTSTSPKPVLPPARRTRPMARSSGVPAGTFAMNSTVSEEVAVATLPRLRTAGTNAIPSAASQSAARTPPWTTRLRFRCRSSTSIRSTQPVSSSETSWKPSAAVIPCCAIARCMILSSSSSMRICYAHDEP